MPAWAFERRIGVDWRLTVATGFASRVLTSPRVVLQYQPSMHGVVHASHKFSAACYHQAGAGWWVATSIHGSSSRPRDQSKTVDSRFCRPNGVVSCRPRYPPESIQHRIGEGPEVCGYPSRNAAFPSASAMTAQLLGQRMPLSPMILDGRRLSAVFSRITAGNNRKCGKCFRSYLRSSVVDFHIHLCLPLVLNSAEETNKKP